ncbi:MAG TPA: hypothetical protein EYQ31_15375, partial [Candidatus Handelsmanbacteria bacterium]|nr:hypothetical protein [Candidatus Handelsmanbacteria bacterium]
MSPALKAPPDVAAPLYLSRVEENFWTHRLDELGALYVRLKIVRNGEDESIAQFADRMAKEAADPSIRNLILDLRHLPGGNDYLTPERMR